MKIIGLQNAAKETLIALEICRLQFNPVSVFFSCSIPFVPKQIQCPLNISAVL